MQDCTASAQHRLQSHIQSRLLPQRKHPLVPHPLVARLNELEIEMPQDLGEDKAHLGVGEAGRVSTFAKCFV
jgi:hypothetical protein